MIIHHVRASGFKIMGEPLALTFPDEGRIGILGQNECGKTTLFQVIESALYGIRGRSGVEGNRQNLVTWGKNEAKLEIEFTSGPNRYNLQRSFGSKSGHKAILAPVINGSRDRASALTGLKDMEAKIEQITGMDRDTFTKLVYIRQKDLDALKELAKSKREQLVNKVMGIDLFDDASAKVKEDISDLEDAFEKMNLHLEEVRHNKEEYETKQEQKTEQEGQSTKLQQTLIQQTANLKEAKVLLAKYEWLNNHNSTREAISLMEKQSEQVKKDLERVSELRKSIERYKAISLKYKPEILSLKSMLESLSDVERRLNEAETAATSLETRRQANIEKLGLSGKDLELLSTDLSRSKHQHLVMFGIELIIGLALVFSAFLTTLLLAIIGFLLLGGAAYAFVGYSKADKLIARNFETESLTKQLREKEKVISDLKKDREGLTSSNPLKTSQEIQDRLKAISLEMKEGSGEETLEGLEAVQRNAEKSLEDLESADPAGRERDLEEQMQGKRTNLEEMLKNKPESADEILYSEKAHASAKNRCEKLQNECNATEKESGRVLGTLQQLNADLTRLKPDYDRYPTLEKEAQENKANIELLRLVLSELSETSKGLRNKVIPHARFIINQILPTLTADRYSDFEITEDLKFKVHSNEAGGYKEREVFSGGTQDQFLIALRLAFTQSILDSRVLADKYSLLMDECTSSSDEIRKQGVFEVLNSMKQTFSQIFIIAHEDISNFVDHHIVLDRNSHGYTEIRSKSW